MYDWLTILLLGFIHALEVAVLPAFALLVLVSLGYRARTGRWLALWKLGLVLLLVTLVATALLSWRWHEETQLPSVGACAAPLVTTASA